MYSIETNSLTKRYRDVLAVDGLDLKVREGELFSLLGVNGAGKTTAVKMLSCLAAPSSGGASVGGYDLLSESEKIKKIIAISPQETAVAPNLTARENLELICGVHGFGKDRAREKIADLSDRFGLSDILGRKAGKLSGGWQRRLSIAMALISEPKILFLDEPTLGLDVIARSELWDIISDLKGRTTVILTTHYMEEAEKLSDRIGIMKDGSLLTVGTAKEIMEMTGKERFEDAFVSVVRGCGV
ncbi:MAG: ABC transporter ATP-binding protein [Clostridia bacterium]|nr:ABC transporter ATP-binding protein [Clostridia bacterium]